MTIQKPRVNVGKTVVSLVKRTQYTIDVDTPRANWFQRVMCVILDWFIAAFIFGVPVVFIIDPIFGEERLTAWFGLTGKTLFDGSRVTWSTVVFYLVFAFYRPLAQALFHQTFGERLLRIYVANIQRTQLHLVQVIKRHACPTIVWLGIAFQHHFSIYPVDFICFLLWTGGSLRAFKSDRRTVLDLFSGSYVYKKPR